VWRDDRNIATNGSDIYGTQITDAGAVAKVGGTALVHSAHIEQLPALASNTTGVLLVWRDADAHLIQSLRLSTGGSAAGAKMTTVGLPAVDETEPTVAPSGTGFTVVWQQIDHGADWNVKAAQVAGDGAVVASSRFGVAGGVQPETDPVVVDGPPGTLGVVYARFAPLAPLSSERVFLRTVTL
jgi:hypothetical protein